MFKRIKRLLRKRNNGGFTLAEVIVATALLGILVLGVFGFVSPVLSSIKANEQNARATMLAETVESYIANSTKYAYYVATFSGVTAADVTSTNVSMDAKIGTVKYSGTEEPYKTAAGTLDGMRKRMDALGTENFEMRCIGMRWLTDQKSGNKKLMLTNEVVNQKNFALDLAKSKQVFESCFYEGLYPVLYFKNFTNQYQVMDKDTSTVVDKYEEKDLKIAAALEITMDVYVTPECYSTTEATRNKALKAFSGTLFADYNAIRNFHINGGDNKLLPNAQLNSYDEALASSSSEVYDDSDYGDTYYPDTYIYYLVRKTKTTGGAGGGTPTPSSTSSPEST